MTISLKSASRLLAALLCIAVLSNTAAAQTDIDFSYCAGYGKFGAELFWGSESNAHLSAAVKLDRNRLCGDKIIAIRFFIDPAENMKDCMVFIKKALADDWSLYDQEFTPQEGWNTVMLDYPFTIKDDYTELYVGYEMTCNGETIGYNRINVEIPGNGDNYVRNGYGEWQTLTKLTGAPAQLSLSAILTGGDYQSQPDNGLAFIPDRHQHSVVTANEPFNFYATVFNTGVNTLRQLTVSYLLDGSATEYRQTIETSLLNYFDQQLEIPVTVPEGSHTVHVKVKGANEDVYNAEFTVNAHPRTWPHRPLVELFTSQYCSNCPEGEAALDKVLDKCGAEVTRIAHHSGFAEDNFTIAASDAIAAALGVTSAPSMALNRATDLNGNRVFHPAYSGVTMFQDYIRARATVGTTAECLYHTPDHIVTAKVSAGECEAGAYTRKMMLHAVVCEDHLTDFQTGKGTSYPAFDHSHAARAFLTPVEGVAVEFDAEGNADYEFSAEIPLLKKGFDGATHPLTGENLNLVTFLTDEAGEVINSAVSPVAITSESGIGTITATEAQLVCISSDGTIALLDDSDSAYIYNLSGIMCGTLTPGQSLRLPAGFYLVRTASGLLRKIAI